MIRNPPTVTANTRFNTTRILPMMFMIVPQVPRRGVHDRSPFGSTPSRYYGSRMRAEICRHPPALSSENEHFDCSRGFGGGEPRKTRKIGKHGDAPSNEKPPTDYTENTDQNLPL